MSHTEVSRDQWEAMSRQLGALVDGEVVTFNGADYVVRRIHTNQLTDEDRADLNVALGPGLLSAALGEALEAAVEKIVARRVDVALRLAQARIGSARDREVATSRENWQMPPTRVRASQAAGVYEKAGDLVAEVAAMYGTSR